MTTTDPGNRGRLRSGRETTKAALLLRLHCRKGCSELSESHLHVFAVAVSLPLHWLAFVVGLVHFDNTLAVIALIRFSPDVATDFRTSVSTEIAVFRPRWIRTGLLYVQQFLRADSGIFREVMDVVLRASRYRCRCVVSAVI